MLPWWIKNPYQNDEILNLDWVISNVKQIIEDNIKLNNRVTSVEELAAALKEFVETYFDNLDVQQEVNTKIDEMVASGVFADIVNPLLTPFFNDINNTIGELRGDIADNTLDITSNSNAIDNLNTRVTSIISTLTSGVEVVTSTAAMTDHNKLYLLTTDGEIYYWNGSAFVSSGVTVASITNALMGSSTYVNDTSTYASYDDLPMYNIFLVAANVLTEAPSNAMYLTYKIAIDHTSLASFIQVAFSASGDMYYRWKTSGAYTRWFKFRTSEDTITSQNTIITNTNTYTDVDDLPVNTIFYVTSNGLNMAHTPFTQAYTIITTGTYGQGSNALNGRIQIGISNDGKMMYRISTSVSYGIWFESNTTYNSPTSQNTILSNTNTYSDVDDLPSNTIFYITSTGLTMDNSPFNVAYTIITTGTYGSNNASFNGKIQVAFSNDGDMAFRIATSASYNSWQFVYDRYHNDYLPPNLVVSSDYNSSLYIDGVCLHPEEKQLMVVDSTNYAGKKCKVNNLSAAKQARIYDNQYPLVKNVTFKATSATGQTATILVIGDSLTRLGGYLDKLAANAAADGNTYTFLGSYITSGGVRNEGRGGWSVADYYDKQSYLTDDNYFFDPNTQKFDINYYLTNKGYSAPDLVLLALGTNDTNQHDYKSTYDDIVSKYQWIINNCKSYVNKVAVWAVPPAAKYHPQFLVSQEKINRYNKLLLPKLSNAEICYGSIMVDPEFGYDVQEVTYNPYTTKKFYNSPELHHFGEAGMKELGDQVYNFIRWYLAQ